MIRVLVLQMQVERIIRSTEVNGSCLEQPGAQQAIRRLDTASTRRRRRRSKKKAAEEAE